MLVTMNARVLADSRHKLPATFAAQPPGTGLGAANQVLVALPIKNAGPVTVTNVTVTDIHLREGAHVIMPSTLPMVIGNLAVGNTFILDTAFEREQHKDEEAYEEDEVKSVMTVRGTYVFRGHKFEWQVRVKVKPPQPAPGSATAGLFTSAGFTTAGAPFPPKPIPQEGEVEANGELGPPVPAGTHVGGPLISPETVISDGVLAANGGTSVPGLEWAVGAHERTVWTHLRPAAWKISQPAPVRLRAAALLAPSDPVLFKANTTIANKSCCVPALGFSFPPDTSGDTNGSFVVATANTFENISSDGGNTFTQTNPTTYFSDNPDGGFCCDQIVQFAPKVNRFFWLIQTSPIATGQNRLRLCWAQPPKLSTSDWSCGDITPGLVGATGPCNTTFGCFDYPDLALTNENVIISADASWAGGLIVLRLPLSDVQACSSTCTLHWGFTNPANSTNAWGAHLAQNAGSNALWSGQIAQNKLRIFRWTDGSTQYDWHDIDLTNSWTRGGNSSNTPSGVNWLSFGFPGNAVIGATVTTGPSRHPGELFTEELWLAWMAAAGSGLQQSHLEVARVDLEAFELIQQFQIANNSFAFAYPALATNANFEVGISLAFGGGNFEAGHAVGFVKDNTFYRTGNSDASISRFGDYSAIRPDSADGRLFAAFGYNTNLINSKVSTNCAVNPGCNFNTTFVLFGRQSDVGTPPPPPPK